MKISIKRNFKLDKTYKKTGFHLNCRDFLGKANFYCYLWNKCNNGKIKNNLLGF